MSEADNDPPPGDLEELRAELARVRETLPPAPPGQRWVRVLHVWELDNGGGLITGDWELRPLLQAVR